MRLAKSASDQPFVIQRNDGIWELNQLNLTSAEADGFYTNVKARDPYALMISGYEFAGASYPFVYDKILSMRMRAEYNSMEEKASNNAELSGLIDYLEDNMGELSYEATEYLASLDKPLAAISRLIFIEMTNGEISDESANALVEAIERAAAEAEKILNIETTNKNNTEKEGVTNMADKKIRTIAFQVDDQDFVAEYEARVKASGLSVKNYFVSLIKADIAQNQAQKESYAQDETQENAPQAEQTHGAPSQQMDETPAPADEPEQNQEQAHDTSSQQMDETQVPAAVKENEFTFTINGNLAERLNECLNQTGKSMQDYMSSLVDTDLTLFELLDKEPMGQSVTSAPVQSEDISFHQTEDNGFAFTINGSLAERLNKCLNQTGESIQDYMSSLVDKKLIEFESAPAQDEDISSGQAEAPDQQQAVPAAPVQEEMMNLFVKITKDQREALEQHKNENGETVGSVLNRLIKDFLTGVKDGSQPENFNDTYSHYDAAIKSCDTTCSAKIPVEMNKELSQYLESTGKSRNVLMSSLVHIELHSQEQAQNQSMSM